MINLKALDCVMPVKIVSGGTKANSKVINSSASLHTDIQSKLFFDKLTAFRYLVVQNEQYFTYKPPKKEGNL